MPKPQIAHRDIKSKNILLKSPTVACLADFGLALTQSGTVSTFNKVDANSNANQRVGTKRYMPPELLSDGMKFDDFESFKMADIYSFGLVMWETCRRAVTKIPVEQSARPVGDGDQSASDDDDEHDELVDEYKVPYYDVVPSDPSFDDMKKVVMVDAYRPPIPDRWQTDQTLNQVTKVIKECWHQNPAARLPALRIKKNLVSILAQIK